MKYISAREAAIKWGLSQEQVEELCSRDRIDDAQLVDHMWIIPVTSSNPLTSQEQQCAQDPMVSPELQVASTSQDSSSKNSSTQPIVKAKSRAKAKASAKVKAQAIAKVSATENAKVDSESSTKENPNVTVNAKVTSKAKANAKAKVTSNTKTNANAKVTANTKARVKDSAKETSNAKVGSKDATKESSKGTTRASTNAASDKQSVIASKDKNKQVAAKKLKSLQNTKTSAKTSAKSKDLSEPKDDASSNARVSSNETVISNASASSDATAISQASASSKTTSHQKEANRALQFSSYNGKVKSFLKWAGGKGQLLAEIEKYYPFQDGQFTKYAEPFVGGGAVLFDVLSKFNLKEVYISDVNAELINTYRVIKEDVEQLISMLSKMQEEFTPLDTEHRKAYFLVRRERFNALKLKADDSINVEKAALMIFINKTCFNGLYRVNKQGEFNVSLGEYKAPKICDAENLKLVSKMLQNVTIVCGDYHQVFDFVDQNTFVYFDPPYRPLTSTASFTAYTECEFGDKAQEELADFIAKLHDKGARIVISNSDPKNVDVNDDFFDRVYSSYYIRRVDATRMINSNSQARGKIKELLISNFKV